MISIPVLMYHHIADDREVTAAGFENQLKYLKEKNYYTPSLQEFYLHITNQKPITKKSVLITFDDGYADNWICAYPLLKKYGFRAVVFVTTKNIQQTPDIIRKTITEGAKPPDTITDERSKNGFLSWQELKLMTESKVFEVGSHTHTHKNYDKKAGYKNLEEELEISRDLIVENLGVKFLTVAWPWGFWQKNYIELAKKTGYKTAFTAKGGANTPAGDPYKIKRFKVQKNSLAWLKTRLAIYQNPLIANIYGSIYGLDTKIKRIIFGS
jgi:peptidoglycan/xylan/chitin deacetylase (PgdA/CDA1 family)